MANEMLEGLGITEAELNDWLKEPKKKKKKKGKESKAAKQARLAGERKAMDLSPDLVASAKKKRAEQKRKEEGFLSETTGRREDLGTEALPVIQAMERAAEREKFGGVGEADLEARHQREKGLMGGIGGMPPSQRARLESEEAGGERIAFDDPRIAGRTSWRGSSEERRKQKEAREGVSIPFTKEMGEEQGGRRITPYRPDIMRDGKMDWRGKEKELGGESIDLSDPRNIGESIPFTEEMREETGGVRDTEKEAAMNMADDEYAMYQAQKAKRDEGILTAEGEYEQRQQSEEFLANASEEEQNEVISAAQTHTGNFSEQTASAKEATGRFVRYDGATKKGITLSKTRLQELYDRKGKMALLQHVPQENRAALLFNWGLISKEDLSDTQQQSAKEVLELEKIQLQVAELKNKTGKMSDTEKAQVTAASNGLAQAVKERRWPEAEAFQTQLNELMPDRKPLDFETIQKDIDKKLLERPKLQKVKSLMGTQVWDGYFEFKNDLVKKIDLLKRSTAGSGELAKFLGGTIDTGEHQGKTWSDVLEGQGVPSWKTVEGMNKNSAKAKEIASRISGGKHEDITRISRGKYMGHVLPQMRQMIMKEQYGNWYTTIETELHGAQAEATTEAQESVNSNDIDRPESAPSETETETQVEPPPPQPQSALPPTPEQHAASLQQEGGRVVEQPPEASLQKVEEIQDSVEAEKAAEEALLASLEPAQQKKFAAWTKKHKPKGETAEKGYKKFLDYSVKMLEDRKGDTKFLKILLENHRMSMLKKSRAEPKKDHTFEDFNIEYINMLLNK